MPRISNAMKAAMSINTESTDPVDAFVRLYRANKTNKGKALKTLLAEVSASWKKDVAAQKASKEMTPYRKFLQEKLRELGVTNPNLNQQERMQEAQRQWSTFRTTLPPRPARVKKDPSKMTPYQRFVSENMPKVRGNSNMSTKEAMRIISGLWAAHKQKLVDASKKKEKTAVASDKKQKKEKVSAAPTPVPSQEVPVESKKEKKEKKAAVEVVAPTPVVQEKKKEKKKDALPKEDVVPTPILVAAANAAVAEAAKKEKKEKKSKH